MNFGAFLIIWAVAEQENSEMLDAFRGLGWRSPLLGECFSIFLFSLIGLPPCVGFVGKFLLFSAAIQKQLYVLAIFGVLNSAIALFYYAKIMKVMYFEKSEHDSPIAVATIYKTLAIALAIPTIVLGLYWKPIQIDIPTMLQTKDKVASKAQQ